MINNNSTDNGSALICLFTLDKDVVAFPHHTTLDIHVYIFIPLYIIVIILSICGNTLIFFIILTKTKMKTFTNILLCNCAMADLFITVFAAIFGVIDTLESKGRWYIGPFMCSFVHFCVISSVAAKIESLTVISMDRLFAVTSPYKKILSERLLFVIIPLIWLIAFSFASPITFTQSVVNIENFGPICVEKWSSPFSTNKSPRYYTLILFLFLYSIPLLTMSIVYSVIAKKLGFVAKIRVNKKMKTEASKVAKRLSIKNVDIELTELCGVKDPESMTTLILPGFHKERVVRMMVIMIITFAICWLPVFILQFVSAFYSNYKMCGRRIEDWAYALSYILQYSNSATDPFLYFWLSSTFKKELISLCQRVVKLKVRMRKFDFQE